jgi:hypothetical protein
MSLIPDYGFHKANVVPCLLSLKYCGHVVAEDPNSCRMLFTTLRGCGQAWACEALARTLSPYTEAFALRPWGVAVLDAAISYSPELYTAVRLVLQKEARRGFFDMDRETLYRVGWMSMRMAAMVKDYPDLVGMQEIMETMALRLSTVAAGEIVRVQNGPPPRPCDDVRV